MTTGPNDRSNGSLPPPVGPGPVDWWAVAVIVLVFVALVMAGMLFILA